MFDQNKNNQPERPDPRIRIYGELRDLLLLRSRARKNQSRNIRRSVELAGKSWGSMRCKRQAEHWHNVSKDADRAIDKLLRQIEKAG